MGTLRITADVDKAANAREVPLTAEARAVLERCGPDHGPIFGVHDIRVQLKRAAAKVLDADRAAKFSLYDLRHARAVEGLRASGNLLGVAFLLRHKQLTTTNRYLRSEQAHGASVVAALDGPKTRRK